MSTSFYATLLAIFLPPLVPEIFSPQFPQPKIRLVNRVRDIFFFFPNDIQSVCTTMRFLDVVPPLSLHAMNNVP